MEADWGKTVVGVVEALAVWPVALIIVFFALKGNIVEILNLLKNRLAHGAGLKIAGFELEAIKASRAQDQINSAIKVDRQDIEEAEKARYSIYTNNRFIMVVHRLWRSNTPGQLYDVMLYVMPHDKGFLPGVKSVTYYFGKNFGGNGKFVCTDKANNFALLISTYGPLSCLAEIEFTDGHKSKQVRYIDFEMGDCAPAALISANPSRPKDDRH